MKQPRVRRHGNAIDPSTAPSRERALDRIQATARELRELRYELEMIECHAGINAVDQRLERLKAREDNLRYLLGRLL